MKAMEPGYKSNQVVEPATKSEEQVKKEREELWSQLKEDVSGVDINHILIKQNCEELFGLEITERKSLDQ
jgi:hypothetical protein